MDYSVPGVYVEEISTFPPSVAPVATAIPAFIGYTEIAIDTNNNTIDEGIVVRRIESMLEYKRYFGSSPYFAEMELESKDSGGFGFVRKQGLANADTLHQYLMYYALRFYFNNGGGSCYIVSVGRFSATPSIDKSAIEEGIDILEQYDEPTLIVLTDAILLPENDYYTCCERVLAQCNTLKDRFAIFDVLENDHKATDFRMGVGSNFLNYGAAYTPFLRTTLTYQVNEEEVNVGAALGETVLDTALTIRHPLQGGNAPLPQVEVDTTASEISFQAADSILVIETPANTTAQALIEAWDKFTGNKGLFAVTLTGTGIETITASGAPIDLDPIASISLASIKNTNTQLYNQFKAELNQQRVILPPSAGIAGIYASVDRNRGVWKAPANVSLASVIEPIHNITNTEQAGLNIDPNSGKSINAIRSFTGKGVLVWGGRTLEGNSNEWRYINVRRLFIFIEESIQKATSFVVFEPNTATTWLKVKGLIESFLYKLWQQGALAGPTPESAYIVNVGLGKTMTQQDILDGNLIVEIAVAAARPAEFIILRFMHKLQEA